MLLPSQTKVNLQEIQLHLIFRTLRLKNQESTPPLTHSPLKKVKGEEMVSACQSLRTVTP